MNMKGLNLGKMKKVSSDKESATFQHQDGHTIKIATKNLSHKLKSELDKIPMAEGGKVEKSQGISDQGRAIRKANEYAQSSDQSFGKPASEGAKEAAKGYARARGFQEKGTKPKLKGLAQGGRVKAVDGLDALKQALNPDFSDYSRDQAVQNAPDIADASQDPIIPTGQAGITPQQQVRNSPMAQQQPMSPEEFSQDPNEDQEPAETTAPQPPQPPSIGKALIGRQSPQETAQALNDEYMAAKNDFLSGKIAPETYQSLFAKKDTLGKVGTLFGMLMSGFGSGLSHQPNMVMDMMNKEIERDLDAQKTTKTNQANFFHTINQHHLTQTQLALNKANIGKTQADIGLIKAQTALQNDNDSMQKMQLGVMAHTLGMVNRLPEGSPARQNGMKAAQALSSAIDQSAVQRNAQTAQQMSDNSEAAFQNRNKALSMFPAGSPASRLGEYEAQHHMPGAPGESSLPIPEEKRNKLVELDNLSDAMGDAQAYMNKTGKFGPGANIGNRATGKSLQNRLELEIGKLEGLGRFTPEEAKRYKAMIPNLTGTHFTSADQNRLNNLTTEIREQKKNIGKSYGAPKISGGESPQQGSSGDQIQTMGGVQYKKVPGGWQRMGKK